MIIREFFRTREDGVNLYRTYSDQGFMLRQIETNVLYREPIDIEGAPYTYEETDELINKDEYEPDEISAEEFMTLVEEAL